MRRSIDDVRMDRRGLGAVGFRMRAFAKGTARDTCAISSTLTTRMRSVDSVDGAEQLVAGAAHEWVTRAASTCSQHVRRRIALASQVD
jgi:hypothetical protein